MHYVGGNNQVAFATILRKEVTRFSRIWLQTVVPSVISTSMYFIIFGALIGQRIGTIDGQPYVDYITPGLILMAIINNSYSNVSSSFFSSKFQRNVEEVLVAPVRPVTILLGYVTGGVLRGIGIGLVVALVARCFTPIEVHDWGLAILVGVLTAVLFSLGGLINGILARDFDDISIIPTFVLLPLIYLGGVFYSISMLPEFWRGVSLLNPILYVINAFRLGILGVSDVDVRVAIAILVFLIVALTALAQQMLARGARIKS